MSNRAKKWLLIFPDEEAYKLFAKNMQQEVPEFLQAKPAEFQNNVSYRVIMDLK